MERKVIHFSPGPSKLPYDVLLEAQKELIYYQDTGISLMEMSHRSKEFQKIMDDTENCLRNVLSVPEGYTVLFMQGGATAQFAAVPLNLIGLKEARKAHYIVTGAWSNKAAVEAEKYGTVDRISVDDSKFTSVPDPSTWNLDSDASYVYYCDNETIHGVEFPFIPETNGIPLVCDMSSNILTRKFDISKFALIYAGVQKNMGPAGVTIVIIRDELIRRPLSGCPTILDYSVQKKHNSLHNTPPCFNIYMVGKVLGWVSAQGGCEEMERRSHEKSQLLYREIELSNGFYRCFVDEGYRSRVNVTLTVAADTTGNLNTKFAKEALDDWSMTSLGGHRSVGGLRVSLYNAISLEDVQTLIRYMHHFQSKYGQR